MLEKLKQNKFVESFIHFESVEEMEALNSNGKKETSNLLCRCL